MSAVTPPLSIAATAPPATAFRQPEDFPLSGRLQLRLPEPMTDDDFLALSRLNEFLRFEMTAQGELIIMPPSGGESAFRDLAIGAQLHLWAKKRGSGKAYGSSVGFKLPKGGTRSPDTSWLTSEQLASIPTDDLERLLPVCPYFAVEVLSPTDSLPKLQEKMQEYLDNGTKLAWLIDPYRKHLHVYRPGRPVEILDKPASLSGDPDLPGFIADLDDVWPQ